MKKEIIKLESIKNNNKNNNINNLFEKKDKIVGIVKGTTIKSITTRLNLENKNYLFCNSIPSKNSSPTY